MILSTAEASLFFRLMLPLQFFVNEKLGVLPQIKSFEEYCQVSMREKFDVRNALFADVGLIDDFIDENPQDIPMKHLTIVSRWKKFCRGDFYIERYLKDCAVFISDETEVYAVWGLTESLTEYFPKYALPVRLESVVLLPFQTKIVTDGFFLPQRVISGGELKSELREVYAQAKRKDKIVKSF
ncbi:MAG TPA: hypothetical protein VF599_24365 [Pyrinomonadaceae bacterium]|jgi:hypothetical protein